MGNPIVEIRWSYGRLISTMWFPILIRWHLYMESGPRHQQPQYWPSYPGIFQFQPQKGWSSYEPIPNAFSETHCTHIFQHNQETVCLFVLLGRLFWSLIKISQPWALPVFSNTPVRPRPPEWHCHGRNGTTAGSASGCLTAPPEGDPRDIWCQKHT